MKTFIQCKACNGFIDKKASACAACGQKVPMGTGKKFALWMLGGMVGMMVLAANTETTPEQQAARAAESARENLAVGGARTLRTMMRDPDSFQLISAHVTESGAACFKYRSRNGFGGMSMGAAFAYGSTVHASDAKSEYPALWDKFCVGKAWDLTGRVNSYL